MGPELGVCGDVLVVLRKACGWFEGSKIENLRSWWLLWYLCESLVLSDFWKFEEKVKILILLLFKGCGVIREGFVLFKRVKGTLYHFCGRALFKLFTFWRPWVAFYSRRLFFQISRKIKSTHFSTIRLSFWKIEGTFSWSWWSFLWYQRLFIKLMTTLQRSGTLF